MEVILREVRPNLGDVRALVARWGQSPVPHTLTRKELLQTLLSLIGGAVIVASLMLVFKPPDKPFIPTLLFVLVFGAGLTIFGLLQNLRGQRGVGWLGALVTAFAATSTYYLAIVLAR